MKSGTKNSKLYDKLKEDILCGVFPADFQFPPEVSFAETLGVSRNTLRLALKQLEADGLILRIGSKGTFVNPDYMQKNARRYLLILPSTPQPRHSEHIIPEITSGIEEALYSRNIDLEKCTHEHLMTLSSTELTEMITRRRISGILWQGTNFLGTEKVFLTLKKLPIPVVLLYCNPEDYRITGWAAIPRNTRNTWIAALRYLRRCGHRSIGFIDPFFNGLVRSEFKPEEHMELLGKLGLDTNTELIVPAEETEEAVEKSVGKLMSLPEPPTAILCYSDYWAPLVYRALKKLDLHIPEDVSVMGYCGTSNSAYMNPPLSTVAIKYSEVGGKAIEILDEADQWFSPDCQERSLPPFIPAGYTVTVRQSIKVLNQKRVIKNRKA